MWSLWPRLSYTFTQWLWVKAEREKHVCGLRVVCLDIYSDDHMTYDIHCPFHLPQLPLQAHVSQHGGKKYSCGEGPQKHPDKRAHTHTYTHRTYSDTKQTLLISARELAGLHTPPPLQELKVLLQNIPKLHQHLSFFASTAAEATVQLDSWSTLSSLVRSRLLRWHFIESRPVQLLSPCKLRMIR